MQGIFRTTKLSISLEKHSQDAKQSCLAKPVQYPRAPTAVLLQLTNLHLQVPSELSWPALQVSSHTQAAHTGLKRFLPTSALGIG